MCVVCEKINTPRNLCTNHHDTLLKCYYCVDDVHEWNLLGRIYNRDTYRAFLEDFGVDKKIIEAKI